MVEFLIILLLIFSVAAGILLARLFGTKEIRQKFIGL